MNVVVLPAPLVPNNPNILPYYNSKFIPLTAFLVPPGILKFFIKFTTFISAFILCYSISLFSSFSDIIKFSDNSLLFKLLTLSYLFFVNINYNLYENSIQNNVINNNKAVTLKYISSYKQPLLSNAFGISSHLKYKANTSKLGKAYKA